MNRRKARENAFFMLFENSFNNYSLGEILENKSNNTDFIKPSDFTKEIFIGVKENENKIDEIISKYSTKWHNNRISKVSMIILRIAIFEIIFKDDIPKSVSVNEAVELAKKYGNDEEPSFINGILGSVCRDNNI